MIMQGVRAKQQELKDVDARLASLQEKLDETKRKSQELDDEVKLTGTKIDRAKSLVSGLGSEQERWGATSHDLSLKLHALTGDVLVAAATTAFLGVFSMEYRKIIATWESRVASSGLPSSSGVGGLVSTVGDPVQIQSWHMQGLLQTRFPWKTR